MFKEALDYKRPVRWARAKRALGELIGRGAAKPRDPLEQAEHHVIRVISLRSNEHTARKDIMRELSKIEGFTPTGQRAFQGRGSYGA